MKRFVTDMGVLGAFRADNGSECNNRTFPEYCDGLGIRRELTARYTPQQNGAMETSLARTMKAGSEEQLKAKKIFPDVNVDRV